MPEMQPIPMDTEWIECESSNLARYGYSQIRKAIVVQFKDKQGNPLNHWQYQGEKALGLFQKMLIAESVGKFFFANIRNNDQLKGEELKGTGL